MRWVDLADEHAGLAWLAHRAPTVGISDGLARLLVAPDEVDRVKELCHLRHESDGAERVVEIHEVRVAFRRAVNFSDLADVEALHELSPDLRTKPVAEHQLHVVPSILRFRRCQEQEAAQLADVLRRRCAELEKNKNINFSLPRDHLRGLL